MPSSINTNIAAYSARSNIERANNSAAASIARLSSGNRITRAADDVAALSTGTSLRTQVTSLKQALVNTSQGSSLLQVADGALGQIVDILQRQKALAVQAGSGSLSDVDRSFLNQEFTALTAEIDRIADGTKFSSVNLLNGGLSGSSSVRTDVNDSAAAALSTAGPVVTIVTPANNDKISINGVEITFTTSAPGTADAAGKVSIGSSATNTAANLVEFLNLSTDPRFANLTFTNAAGVVNANYSGGLLGGAYVVDAASITGTNATAGTAVNRTIAAGSTDGLGVDRTKATGRVTGSVLANGGTAATNAGPSIVTRTIEDNLAFVGKLGEGALGNITGAFTILNTAVFALKAGDITYTTAATNITGGAAPIALTFTGRDVNGVAAGGTFTVNIAGGTFAAASIAGQTDVTDATNQINAALSGITFTQNRDITTFQEGQIVTVAGIQVGQLNGASANFSSGNFTNVNIESINITAPGVGQSDAVFEATINGQLYRSTSGIGSQIGTNKSIQLSNLSDPTKTFTIQTGNVALTSIAGTSFDLTTQEKASAVAKGLQDAFGLTGTGGRITFQVGADASDNLAVKVDSVKTGNIYQGKTLSVGTLADASAASASLDAALNTVTAIRSTVGALQSRFDFAAANAQTSLQNQDAARGALLDTDVTSESTAYATAQVQLQAGIAVLAQANQLPQNLLKLIS